MVGVPLLLGELGMRFEQQGVAGALGRLGGGAGLVGLQRQRHDHVRQHDVVAQRENRQGEGVEIGQRGLLAHERYLR